MGCSLLSIVEIIFYILITIRSTFDKLYQKVFLPTAIAPRSVVQVISQDPEEKIDRMMETLNTLERRFEEIQKRILETQEQNQLTFEKIDQRFALIE